MQPTSELVAMVERLKARGLIKVLPAGVQPARPQEKPAVTPPHPLPPPVPVPEPELAAVKVDGRTVRRPMCRWCGSRHKRLPDGNCARCGRRVTFILGHE